jgi:leukotriene-A4 hydrolase
MDRSSHAKPNEAVVTHLDWRATVDFDKEILSAEASYTIRRLSTECDTVFLDTSKLIIQSVITFDGAPLSYTLHPPTDGKAYLGQKLSIGLPPRPATNLSGSDSNLYNPNDPDVCHITIVYQTTNECSAIQWLPPSQTAGKKYPYLFTQCQAIHARSLIPCQDCCGVKMTYKAIVTVPSWATCVMSALLQTSTTEDDSRVFTWDQPVPISSYLFAMAVGDLAKKDISERCSIWTEPSLVEVAAYEFAETEDFLKIAEDLAGRKYAWGRYDLLLLPPSFPYGGMENPCLTFVTPTLLAGDRSLADVVAHEIAHSWTGNLITNVTWDHFWLNEGWTTWFQRKIMARIKKDPNFLDFDAIGGRKDLQDTVEDEMPPEFTRLVLDIGDKDPDDAYSIVAYEKGFTLLLSLERRVGTKEFEAFFQAYVSRFAAHTLSSQDFKEFFQYIFEGNDKIKDIDWDAWFHQPGMPPELPELDQSMARDSKQLADVWVSVDRFGQAPPAQNDLVSWSSLQIACFLDAVQSACGASPLKLTTVQVMNGLYSFSESKNSEILFRYSMLAVASEDSSILPVAIRFITTQGRMKFVRPLYKALHKSRMGKDLAVTTFLANKDFYHPICAKMVAADLSVGGGKQQSASIIPSKTSLLWLCGLLAVATAGFVLLRRRR